MTNISWTVSRIFWLLCNTKQSLSIFISRRNSVTAQKGRDLLVQVHDGSADFNDENFIVVGGFKSNGITIDGDSVEITTKDSNGFKEKLQGGGNLQINVSGDGVFMDDASFRRVHEHTINKTHPLCRLIMPDFARYEGRFEIASLAMTGNDGEAITYNISLESSGTITVDYL